MGDFSNVLVWGYVGDDYFKIIPEWWARYSKSDYLCTALVETMLVSIFI